jgi:hypothetical protein
MKYVYVDESGSPHLALEDQNPKDHYVICAISAEGANHDSYISSAMKLVNKHAGEGELKSSNIGSASNRRTRILTDIFNEGINAFCLVVDKSRIWRDSGLRFKPSFYKFLHRMFYNRLRSSSLEISVYADEYGHSDFMNSFDKYISLETPLLESFRFISSQETPLIQIADVIAGSVRRIYDGNDSESLIPDHSHNRLVIEEWPPREAAQDQIMISKDIDLVIRTVSLRNARLYVEKMMLGDDLDSILKANAIRYLLWRFELNPYEYVHRQEITDHIYETSGTAINPSQLTSNVFADARDSDVIIASSDSGVKIPYVAADLRRWMARTESQIAPYLRRAGKARNTILIASAHEHDIASEDSFPELSRYLKQL